MARWEDEGRFGGRDDDRWEGRDERSNRDRYGAAGNTRRHEGRDAYGSDWSGRGDWSGARGRWDDDREAWREERQPAREPFRHGGDYGAREYGSRDFDRGAYGTEPSRRGEGWSSGGRAYDRDVDRDRERSGRSGSGDYTTYGQSGYHEPGRGMRRDIVREQGRGGSREGGSWGPGNVGSHGMHTHGAEHDRDEQREGPLERLGERVKEGVRKLTGRGPKGWRRSDERIHDDVCERIARSGVDADAVEVRVENGEVTLTGTVESREDKHFLENLADDVLGVEEVNNHLRVNRGIHDAPSPGQDVRH